MLPGPYEVPAAAYVRRHGPTGLEYNDYKDWVRDEFQFRCVYCMHRERWEKDGWRLFQLDHVIPQTVNPALINTYTNLVYSCPSCNWTHGKRLVPDPCVHSYCGLIRFEQDGAVTALDPLGDQCIEYLGLDSPHLESFRRGKLRTYQRIQELLELVEYNLDDLDDEEALDEIMDLLGYPLELPHLTRKRHKVSTKPGSEKNCYAARLKRGEIPFIY